MVPDRHGASSWKRWIFCPTDHLDFENLENRRRYHNPGKPRTAGLCGREVVASDHLPLSSTFFGRPKSPDLPPKPPLWYHFSCCFPSGDILAKRSRQPLPTQAAHGPQLLQRPRMLPLQSKPHTTPHRRQRLAALLPNSSTWKMFRFPSAESPYLVYSGADFERLGL